MGLRLGWIGCYGRPRTTEVPLLRRLPVLITSPRALVGGFGFLAQPIVEVGELVAEIRYPFVKISSLLPGVVGGRACKPRLRGGAAGSRFGLAAQLFEQPDPLDQSLALCRVHGSICL